LPKITKAAQAKPPVVAVAIVGTSSTSSAGSEAW